MARQERLRESDATARVKHSASSRGTAARMPPTRDAKRRKLQHEPRGAAAGGDEAALRQDERSGSGSEGGGDDDPGAELQSALESIAARFQELAAAPAKGGDRLRGKRLLRLFHFAWGQLGAEPLEREEACVALKAGQPEQVEAGMTLAEVQEYLGGAVAALAQQAAREELLAAAREAERAGGRRLSLQLGRPARMGWMRRGGPAPCCSGIRSCAVPRRCAAPSTCPQPAGQASACPGQGLTMPAPAEPLGLLPAPLQATGQQPGRCWRSVWRRSRTTWRAAWRWHGWCTAAPPASRCALGRRAAALRWGLCAGASAQLPARSRPRCRAARRAPPVLLPAPGPAPRQPLLSEDQHPGDPVAQRAGAPLALAPPPCSSPSPSAPSPPPQDLQAAEAHYRAAAKSAMAADALAREGGDAEGSAAAREGGKQALAKLGALLCGEGRDGEARKLLRALGCRWAGVAAGGGA